MVQMRESEGDDVDTKTTPVRVNEPMQMELVIESRFITSQTVRISVSWAVGNGCFVLLWLVGSLVDNLSRMRVA